MRKSPEILIVGQGIAGTVLHHTLLERGIFAKIINTDLPGRSSAAAAGIINPITGPKYHKSWNFDELMQVFLPFYSKLQQKLNVSFFLKMRMFRYLPGLNQINKWIRRWDDPADAAYYGEFFTNMEGYPEIRDEGRWAEIYNAFRVDLNALIITYREFLELNKLTENELFQFDQLKIHHQFTTYKNQQYDHIIFCEGYMIKDNPYFSYLPVIPAKGEALLVKRKNPGDVMSKRNELITQWNSENVWYGATMQNNFESIFASPESRQLLIEKYMDDFEEEPMITAQLAGLRPTVSDRKPLIGQHPVHPTLYVMNGLGTKGASLAPLMAKNLTDLILDNLNLPEEVDIKRFKLKSPDKFTVPH